MVLDWFKKDKTAPRKLDHPKDLIAGDLLTFKPRSIVPESLQSETLSVVEVTSYQYSEGLVPEFVVRTPAGDTFTMQCSEEEDGEYITLAKELSRDQVLELFDGDAFSELFGESFAEFATNMDNVPEELKSWVGEGYRQSVKEGVAFFYDEDRRSKGVSQYEDDDSEELRFHECEGSPDDYSLNVEIWEDGSTDVYVEVSMPINVIEEMWPNGGQSET